MKHHLYENEMGSIVKNCWGQAIIVDRFHNLVFNNKLTAMQKDEIIRMLFILNKAPYHKFFDKVKWNELIEITDQWYDIWSKILTTPGNPIEYYGKNPVIKSLSIIVST